MVDVESFTKVGIYQGKWNVRISDFENNIVLSGRTFTLKAIVERKRISSGHFVAHMKRNNVWETYDDLSGRVQKPPRAFYPVLAMFCVDEVTIAPRQKFDQLAPVQSSENEVSSSTSPIGMSNRKFARPIHSSSDDMSSTEASPKHEENGTQTKENEMIESIEHEQPQIEDKTSITPLVFLKNVLSSTKIPPSYAQNSTKK